MASLQSRQLFPARKKPWLSKNTAEVRRVCRKKMLLRIQRVFGDGVELPAWTGPISHLTGTLPLEAFLPTRFRARDNCVVARCANPASRSGLCTAHIEWSLRAPVECTAILEAYPDLANVEWVAGLLGLPGVYFDQKLGVEEARKRGMYLLGGLFFDEMFTVMAGKNKNYGIRCSALAAVACAHEPRSVLVRMADAQAFLTYMRTLNPTAFGSMVTNLAEWGYAICPPQGRQFVGLAIKRFRDADGSEHVGRLVLVPKDQSIYVVSATMAHCVNMLYNRSSFTFKVCASRTISTTNADCVIDACSPAIERDIRLLGPAQSAIVLHSECITWGLLYRLVQARCGVTFVGSITPAFGSVRFRLTGKPVGFVWHVIVQASRSAETNGVFDEALPLQETDSLAEIIDPAATGALSLTVPDVVNEVYFSIVSSETVHGAAKLSHTTASAERVVFGGITRKEALARYSRRFEQLRGLLGAMAAS